MTRLFNDPAAFADEMTEGFVAAHGHRVRQVPGGVVRSTATPAGRVAVVVGGGSGHYPAFAGLVGPGLADGAVVGNVFASPSARQVATVARAADHGGGILLTYGNYAGDCLNFDAAQDDLRAAGLDVETVRVTDDIFSAPDAERDRRRGIAGDLVVFKVAGAAAAEGRGLAEVAALARRANDRTRTMGVAFSGCTLPGAAEPLFTVPGGRMAIGLGIHGEPGFAEQALPTADGLADLLVERLLVERPDKGDRAAVLLNGLGSVKHEELFVVYRRVAERLAGAGVTIVAPEVGELCTSFDMAGVSLTLAWLDADLERLWLAPADAAGFHRGRAALVPAAAQVEVAPKVEIEVPEADRESRDAAAVVVEVLHAMAVTIDAHADELGRIDAVAGDGDHGIGMRRGTGAAAAAARDAYDRGAGAGSLLTAAAQAWSDRAGGTSGALWGVALRSFGRTVGDHGRLDEETTARALRAAREAVCAAGGAEPGDKTMVDALIPLDLAFAATVRGGGAAVDAWDAAATAAEKAADNTRNLLPRKGRARPHAERSLGTPDAGAVSLSLVARTVHDVLRKVSS
ncbi:dihydroxyacetone kinase family protein [Virgisporangium ochraceum]|uniref:Erythrulose kinase n=1 Tax=Virgisporangium ochraceum TaxID=65505 RepID=A0A8J4A2R1_9ACTN|nr:dihydroxyacetone kinase family protein [Virgisporangium ochraceum]GIJ73118.1 erythrulose kinase [Virgisporangium ochraceum]